MPTIRLLFALALQPAKAVLERPTSKWPFRALLRGRVRAKWKRYSCDSSAMNRSRIADDEQFILYARVVGNIPAVSILCFFFCVLLLVVWRAARVYLPFTTQIDSSERPSNGKACPFVWCIPITSE